MAELTLNWDLESIFPGAALPEFHAALEEVKGRICQAAGRGRWLEG